MIFSKKRQTLRLTRALCFAFTFSVALLPWSSRFALTFLVARSIDLRAMRSHSQLLRSLRLQDSHSHSDLLCSFELHAHILDCFTLSDFVLCTSVYYIVGHFAPSGFVLRTCILGHFTPSGFALCACILNCFAPSSLALCAHILLA